ncbi:MAG TPA: GAF domain-containing protein [Methylomirabilota bacterium]|nr:GAF domain-containing protein [Methylomirabilota bacterium]
MRARFWGTRGSIAKAGPTTVRYGGNTSCVEVRSQAGTLVILDCGTGAHGLGHALESARTGPLRGHILITHTHWDHIQGFPFFAPFFREGDQWDVYAPRGLRESVREALAGQMQYTYFPVSPEQFTATIRYHELVEGAFTLDDIRITTQYLNHPALTLGYRLEADGAVLVYATDHEPHSRALAAGDGSDIGGEDRRHVELLAGADLVIHDAQYVAAEYPEKAGWGHSTMESVVASARAAGAQRLALYHHDPLRDDAAIERLAIAARGQAAAAGGGLDVFAAAEGLVIDIAPTGVAPESSRLAQAAAEAEVPAELLTQTVLVAVDDPGFRDGLVEAGRADDLKLHTVSDPDQVMATIEAARPSLVLLGRRIGGRDGLEVCRAIRGNGATRDLPVVIVATGETEADRTAGAQAGVTDWLVAPFSPLYARTRIRAWALRQACRWLRAPVPADEEARLRALHDAGILDSPAEERFDRITRLARRVFDVPIALVSLVDAERQWFKSRQGIDVAETPREISFCAHAIHDDRVFLVPDTLTDPRFADNPAVTGDPRVRFYAGRPVHVDGRRVGTLCLVDRRPRELRDDDVRALDDLAILVEKELIEGAAGRYGRD